MKTKSKPFKKKSKKTSKDGAKGFSKGGSKGKGGKEEGKGGRGFSKWDSKGKGGKEGESSKEEWKPKVVVDSQNPYEVFQNRRRRNAVLNERRPGERRNLARSRANSIAERTQTIVQEQLGAGRRSKFRDARLGGDEDGEGGHDNEVQRLVRLRQKETKRSFNLGTEQDLQHGGKSIAELADSELRESVVGSDDEEYWKDSTVDDIVERGRIRKAEEKREKMEHERQLGDLDEGFGDLMSELQFRPPKAQQIRERVEPDTYDKLLKELVYDKKATATERTKTAEEIARDLSDKLEALERAQAARAKGLPDEEPGTGDGDGDAGGEFGRAGGQAEGEGEESDEEDEGDDGEGEESEEEGREEDEAVSDEEGVVDEALDEDDKLGETCVRLFTTSEMAKVNVMGNGTGEDGLPYAPECPWNRLGVEKLLEKRAPKTAFKLIQRVRTRTAVALHADNGAKLQIFFTALLDFAVSVISRSDGDISARGLALVHALRQPLLELALEHPEEAKTYFSAKLEALDPGIPPKAEEFACLKLVALLFPVTDFAHPVVAPAVVLADHWAAQLAALGVGIQDLISEAFMLFEVLSALLLPGKKFCSSFFLLGGAILESCAESAALGRAQCVEAAVDVAALLGKALGLLAIEDSSMGFIAKEELVGPSLRRITASGAAEAFVEVSRRLEAEFQSTSGVTADGTSSVSLQPLRLFAAGPAQIKMLDPIFHDEGDRPNAKGAELSETKQLERRLNKERRAAARQLQRSAAVVQQLQGRKDGMRRVVQGKERARVRRIMEVEKQELKQLGTEFDGSMDTSFGSYSKTKERKKDNKRMAGNATADNPKGSSEKLTPAAKARAAKEGASTKRRTGGKKGSRKSKS